MSFEEVLRFASKNYISNTNTIILTILLFVLLVSKKYVNNFSSLLQTLIVLYIMIRLIMYSGNVDEASSYILLKWLVNPMMKIMNDVKIDHSSKMMIYQALLITFIGLYNRILNKKYMPILDLLVYCSVFSIMLMMCNLSMNVDWKAISFYIPFIISLAIMIIDRLVLLIYNKKIPLITKHENNMNILKDFSYHFVYCSRKKYNLHMNINIISLISFTMYLSYIFFNMSNK